MTYADQDPILEELEKAEPHSSSQNSCGHSPLDEPEMDGGERAKVG